jgi:hypothetical protein
MHKMIASYIGIGGLSETWADQWRKGDDQVRKQANGTAEERERCSVEVREDRDWPFAGPQWVTGMIPGSCG